MGKCKTISTTIFFIVNLILEIADLIVDWLFAFDVYYLESGLVYGRHSDAVKGFILFFASLGTVTFILETVNSFLVFFRINGRRDHFVVGAIVLWIEDIPQAILSIIIAACRKDGSSKFQLAKAGVAIVLAVVQLLLVTYECHQRRTDSNKDKMKKFQIFAVVLVFVGVVCNIAACILVFIFSHSTVQLDGSLAVPAPTTDFEERYNDHYFVDVSIYIYDPSFQSNSEKNALWLKLTTINSLREARGNETSVTFQYRYQESPSELRFTLGSNINGGSTPRECYTLDKSNESISISNCTSSFLQGSVRGLGVQLVFKPPEYVASVFRKTIYGDIFFGVGVWDHERCTPLTQFQNAVPSDAFHLLPAVHYFRSSESSRSTRHLMEDSGKLSFYTKKDLTDVASIWTTGWTKCSATGHVAPQLDTDLTTRC